MCDDVGAPMGLCHLWCSPFSCCHTIVKMVAFEHRINFGYGANAQSAHGSDLIAGMAQEIAESLDA